MIGTKTKPNLIRSLTGKLDPSRWLPHVNRLVVSVSDVTASAIHLEASSERDCQRGSKKLIEIFSGGTGGGEVEEGGGGKERREIDKEVMAMAACLRLLTSSTGFSSR